MSRRSYGNDRYRKEANVGSTRKSASKAKPVRKQGTVAAASGAKEKPKQEKDWTGLPTSPEIKKWRRIWWGLLLGGLGLIALGYVVPELRGDARVQSGIVIVVLLASLAAVLIDLLVIRRLRKQLMEETKPKKAEKGGQTTKAEKAPKGDAGGRAAQAPKGETDAKPVQPPNSDGQGRS